MAAFLQRFTCPFGHTWDVWTTDGVLDDPADSACPECDFDIDDEPVLVRGRLDVEETDFFDDSETRP
jgi:hypothetical protein